MRIVSNEEDLHMSNPVFGTDKKNITSLSSAEYVHRVVKLKKIKEH